MRAGWRRHQTVEVARQVGGEAASLKDHGLQVVVAVRSNAEVQLLGRGAGPEGLAHALWAHERSGNRAQRAAASI